MTENAFKTPEALRVLLDWYAATLPAPKAPRWQRENESGLGKGQWVVCPRCNGTAEITWKKQVVACDHKHCRGRGGWFTDPYVDDKRPVDAHHQPVLSVADFTRQILDMPGPEIDRLCALLDTAQAEPAGRDGRQTPVTLRALEKALWEMRVTHPRERAVLLTAHVLCVPADLGLYQDALLALAETLPDDFAGPQWVLDTASMLRERQTARKRFLRADERNVLIRKLHADGRSLRQIAGRVGLSAPRVRTILRRYGARNAA